jgi:TonB family protein
MDSKATRRFLIVAFALSLLLHLFLTGIIRWPFTPQSDEVQIVSIQHLHTTHIAHIPPPPRRSPAPPPQHRAPVHVAKATAVNPNSTLSEGKAVFGTASPESPTPAATATPNCATNDTPVQMIASPPQPEIPPAARADQGNGIARVRLVVNPQGAIESATIAGSSGSSSMDQIAVVMARAAQYAPATHACKAIASDYTFSVKFYPW